MKEKYIKPAIDINEFKVFDVVTTSGGTGDLRPDDNVVEWEWD